MKDAIEFIRSDNPFRTLPEGFRDVGFNGGASSGVWRSGATMWRSGSEIGDAHSPVPSHIMRSAQ